jgi:hypothetical protein
MASRLIVWRVVEITSASGYRLFRMPRSRFAGKEFIVRE